MNENLRYQFSNYDCGLISLLNAFTYLLKRDNIPAPLVKIIINNCLDSEDENGNLYCGGTSRKAIEKIVSLANQCLEENKIDLICSRYIGCDVTIDKISECLNNNGCVIIRCWQEVEHYVIATKITDKSIYIFDPYYFDKHYYDTDDDVKIITNKLDKYNRKVSIDRVMSESGKDFSLGVINNREIVLINKK